MFTLTKKTDYGIIALAHLAQQPAGVFSGAREIAERYHVPASLLINVLKALCHAELVRSTRGVKGGYALAFPPAEITLADIIGALEGPVRFVQCSGDAVDRGPRCELLTTCPVTRPVRKVHDRLMEFLGQITLAQIAFDGGYGPRGIALSREGAALKTESVA
jgi:Rrf2 family protein